VTKGLGAHWSLDPSITFLNHGSFGACPTAVLDAQARLRARLEAEPVRFFLREMPPLLEEARAALARFVGGDPDDLGFVGNATTGVNAVVRSLRFQEGDEILVTDHAYGACRNAIDHVCERSGARIVTVRIGFPIPTASEDEIVGALAAAASPRTRLAMIDHVTSTTGLVLPIARIVRELQGRGVDVLVDGAHAPGMVPLDVQAIGAAFYTGNCHKWLCAPKGAAFLHVRRDRQDRVHPTTISHGRNAVWMKGSQFRKEFDWVGTTDPTAWLCVPEAIRVIGGLVPGGWDEVRRRNRELALAGRRLLCERLGVEAPCPESMIGSLASIPIGRRGLEAGAGTGPGTAGGLDPLQETLFAQGIEVPVMPWGEGGRLLRISAQLYNDVAQFERLASAVVEAAA
jgi:isopenicillin-N epimerase